MDPGPVEISIYGHTGSLKAERALQGSMHLIGAKYVHALRRKGWRMTKRLCIHLDGVHAEGVSVNGSIVSVGLPNTTADLLSKGPEHQHEAVLNLILLAAARCCARMDWPFEAFEQAHALVLSERGPFIRESKAFRSPDGRHFACVLSVMDEQCTVLLVQFLDSLKRPLNKVELIKTWQIEWLYRPIMQNMKWSANDRFYIANTSEEIKLEAALGSRFVTVVMEPARSTMEELEGALHMITYREFESDEERIAWANR